MKMIIKGRRYDTDTAQQLAEIEDDLTSSFDYFVERLYRKKTGEFFLAGYGGDRSAYGCFAHNEGIFPLSLAEAKEWVEAHVNTIYEDVFGTVEE